MLCLVACVIYVVLVVKLRGIRVVWWWFDRDRSVKKLNLRSASLVIGVDRTSLTSTVLAAGGVFSLVVRVVQLVSGRRQNLGSRVAR